MDFQHLKLASGRNHQVPSARLFLSPSIDNNAPVFCFSTWSGKRVPAEQHFIHTNFFLPYGKLARHSLRSIAISRKLSQPRLLFLLNSSPLGSHVTNKVWWLSDWPQGVLRTTSPLADCSTTSRATRTRQRADCRDTSRSFGAMPRKRRKSSRFSLHRFARNLATFYGSGQ